MRNESHLRLKRQIDSYEPDEQVGPFEISNSAPGSGPERDSGHDQWLLDYLTGKGQLEETESAGQTITGSKRIETNGGGGGGDDGGQLGEELSENQSSEEQHKSSNNKWQHQCLCPPGKYE